MNAEDRLRQLSEAATKGPWRDTRQRVEGEQYVADCRFDDGQPDAALIAYQRNLADPIADVIAAARAVADNPDDEYSRSLRTALAALDAADKEQKP